MGGDPFQLQDKLATPPQTTTPLLFQISKHQVLQQIWSRLVASNPSNLVNSIEEGIKKVKTENFLFMMEKDYYFYNMKGDCSLYPLDEYFFKAGTGVAVQKDSPLLPVFNDGYVKCLRSSLIHSTVCHPYYICEVFYRRVDE